MLLHVLELTTHHSCCSIGCADRSRTRYSPRGGFAHHIKAAAITHPSPVRGYSDAGVAAWGVLVAAREFPKGSVSMRGCSSVIQYLRARREGWGGEGRGGRVTRPGLVSQFGHRFTEAGEENISSITFFNCETKTSTFKKL